MVARHEAGHAVVGTAVASLLPGQPRVEVKDWRDSKSQCMSCVCHKALII